jgi:biopolymer transport protein ExbD
MASLSSPLGLRERLTPPSRRLNPVVLLDVFLVALFFSLLGSQLLMPPGVTVDLPEVAPESLAAVRTDASLAVGPGGSAPGAGGTVPLAESAVLSLKSDRMILFNGEIVSAALLEDRLAAFMRERPASAAVTVLHLKVGGDVPFRSVLEVSAMARRAGFDKVHFAARPRPAGPAPLGGR